MSSAHTRTSGGPDAALPESAPVAEEGPIAVGSVLASKYQLVRLLGKGGMGAVYEARNTSTLKRCAVKLLISPELGQNAAMVKRFFREAKASSVVESDHIVTIYDSGVDPATTYPFMVMELLNGEDLEHTIARLGAVPPMAALKLVLQAASGLGRAHRQGIVHRDIKPANLFVTRRDTGDLVVKVLDFGIAKVKMESVAETSNGLTRTGSMLGTPLYMSPEQAEASPHIDARTDVWSLGAVLYELLSGKIPFDGVESLGQLMVSIITRDVPPIQSRAPWVSPELAEVVHRAMSRDLSARYPSAVEFGEAMARLAPGAPRVTEDMLVPVSESERARTAVPAALPAAHLRVNTREGLAVTATEPPPARRALSTGVVALVSAATIGGLALGAWRVFGRAEPAVVTPPTFVAAPSPSPSPSPQVAELSFELAVSPGDAEVVVDGRPAPNTGGKVTLTGAPGATHAVRISRAGRIAEQTIAITGSGLVPSRLELPAEPTSPVVVPTQGRPGSKPRQRPGPVPVPSGAPAPETPKVKAPTGVSDDTSEFGK